MKKILLMIAASTLLANNSSPQDSGTDFRGVVQFGVKAGINSSNVYDTKGDEFTANAKFGVAGGFFMSIPVGTFLGIQPEILISQRGFKAKGILFNDPYTLTRTTTYIDIPLLLSIKPIENLTLFAGPQYSYLIKQSYKFENASTSIAQEEEFIQEDFRKNTICITGGLDLNVNHLVVGVRAGWDLYNNNGDGTTTTPRYKNVWYQATLGYRFFR